MPHENEIAFFQKLLRQLSIQTLRFPPDAAPEVDRGLRRLAGLPAPDAGLFATLRDNTIYFVADAFSCCYGILLLPGCGEVLLVGPYLNADIPDEELTALLNRRRLPHTLLPTLQHFYSSLALVSDGSLMDALLVTLGETLWGGAEAFEICRLEEGDLADTPLPESMVEGCFAEALDLRLLEERYESERRFMHAVSLGMEQQALRLILNARENVFERRTSDPIRNIKNYVIICNTLLRKAVEYGGVHPLYIDRLSSRMARKIEMIHSFDQMHRLLPEMVSQYCALVREHAMQGYSPLVRHVILRIDADLTADLNLSAHAKALNVSPSYLSTVFRRETGATITEYVSRRRVDHALFLLGATDMQVQTIAQYCGIPDVNYFTKTFKRLTGKTPRQARAEARRK